MGVGRGGVGVGKMGKVSGSLALCPPRQGPRPGGGGRYRGDAEPRSDFPS